MSHPPDLPIATTHHRRQVAAAVRQAQAGTASAFRWPALMLGAVFLAPAVCLGQYDEPPVPLPDLEPPPAVEPETRADARDEESRPERSYFVPSRSTGTRRETEPPQYVRNLGDVDWLKDADASWLDVGVDYRMRYEYRDDDIRRPVAVLDEPILTRSRVYLGVREKFDPLRGYIEFEDARRNNSRFPKDDRDVNETEIIQAVAEFRHDDAFGLDRRLATSREDC